MTRRIKSGRLVSSFLAARGQVKRLRHRPLMTTDPRVGSGGAIAQRMFQAEQAVSHGRSPFALCCRRGSSMKRSMTKLAAAIQDGQGTGTGDNYKPWIRVTRRVSSPCSNTSVVPVPHLTRLTHYLSRAERQFALFIWWLGATDVREQYPLWPWEHVHPAVQLGDDSQAIHPGMAKIAEQAGIPLRNYPGLSLPWILTIDLLVTVSAAVNPSRLIGVSCKPKEILDSGSPSNREIERLELDRRYCLHANIPHRVAHPELLPNELLVQLHWLAPMESFIALSSLTKTSRYQKYVERLKGTAYDRPAWIASSEAGKHVGWTTQLEQRAMRIALWYQHVDVDLSRPVVLTRPFSPGGAELRRREATRWFGTT